MSALGTSLSERELRLAKLDALRERGIEPYPAAFERDHTAADLRGRFAGLGADAETGVRVRVAGRLMLIRRHGGLLFGTLSRPERERAGARLARRARRRLRRRRGARPRRLGRRRPAR